KARPRLHIRETSLSAWRRKLCGRPGRGPRSLEYRRYPKCSVQTRGRMIRIRTIQISVLIGSYGARKSSESAEEGHERQFHQTDEPPGYRAKRQAGYHAPDRRKPHRWVPAKLLPSSLRRTG